MMNFKIIFNLKGSTGNLEGPRGSRGMFKGPRESRGAGGTQGGVYVIPRGQQGVLMGLL